ncbi:aldehyde dehydrogenase family protein [Polymorphum gilvum]|uniref:Aldehyde dehydrogenase 2B4 n=1 Tax=Polymorphum gilvum (strain LMG 25793 / CGMCC 1.9160 / SL003B-26A1) TaxID=991905 RepID=F2J103_POLGS|nr:aldehyde dehydrogenase family protein [Polymorphum gilvum]ADZ71949.1 Aldehyde dehydrogenase 2B4 [Polymorphum gilvum SL003B-26A1]
MSEKSATGTGAILHLDAVIDGSLSPAAAGRRLDVLSPSDGALIATLPRCDAADVGRAVSAARRGFEAGPWARMTAAERGRLLSRLSNLVSEKIDELADLECRDTGKPLRQGRADIAALARYFEFYGGAADKVMGDTIPTADGFLALTLREPHGVVGGIIPWNYPAQIMGRVVGGALAMGNTVVLKPAEDACLSVVRVAALALEAGFPAGVLNVVTGYGDEAGAALANHPGLDFLTFTGSPAVGTLIQAAAARNHIGCTLELGGKSPQILFQDADLDAAVPVVVNAIIQNCGQTCSAGSRVLVQQTIWDEVVEILRARIRALVAGPHHLDLDLGPLISAAQVARVRSFVDRAAADGIPLIAEGAIAPDCPAGGCYTPARLYGPVPPAHPLAREEVFGPVLSMIPFRDEDEAVDLANATDFGLVAGVWTRDGQRGLRMARRIRAGQVFVNAYGAGGGIELPFGGFKKSGHGREKGFEALYEFSATKTVVLRHG